MEAASGSCPTGPGRSGAQRAELLDGAPPVPQPGPSALPAVPPPPLPAITLPQPALTLPGPASPVLSVLSLEELAALPTPASRGAAPPAGP